MKNLIRLIAGWYEKFISLGFHEFDEQMAREILHKSGFDSRHYQFIGPYVETSGTESPCQYYEARPANMPAANVSLYVYSTGRVVEPYEWDK